MSGQHRRPWSKIDQTMGQYLDNVSHRSDNIIRQLNKQGHNPANVRRRPSASLMLVRRLRRPANIKPKLDKRFVLWKPLSISFH